MTTKVRIGLRCYNPYVPNEVWDLFKKELRKIFKLAFPEQKFSITEFYWQGFSTNKEYLQFKPSDGKPVDWRRVWDVLAFTANEFGMELEFVYREEPFFKAQKTDDLFERRISRYSLKSSREWTIPDLDAFLKDYSYDALKIKYCGTFLTT